MNFDKSIKIFEYNLLRQSGVMITPQQVGLANDPFAAMQMNSFGNVLNQLNGSTNGVMNTTAMTLPVMPTPPANPADPVAESKYQQAMVAYQSSMQIYNQRMMQMMLNQMTNMQMSVSRMSANSSASSSSGSGSSSSGDVGIGGII